ncbi:MAG: phosphoribosylglycinamide formyltransferase [Lactobacillaceae bacterium]|jgi:phosphoribosylglycinamide formyltransferase-1|nr:phosphoribosylglycinamide formyltransferase [Lactobacillaceae bacterium]
MGQVTRLAVFASGFGSNFRALQEAIVARQMNAQIVRLVVDHDEIGALQIAEEFRIPATIINYKNFATRSDAETSIINQLKTDEVDGIILAGYLRLLTETLITPYDGKIINIHPALLPSFPGLHGIDDAYNYGVKVTGVTVHFVDTGMDSGEIIAQTPVRIEDGESLDELETKIHAVEHQLYPDTLELLLAKGVFTK